MKTVIAIMALLISTSAVAGLPGSPVLRGRPNVQPAGVPGSPIFRPGPTSGEEQAILAFSQDEMVSESISELQAGNGFINVEEAKAMQIDISCGFAGCTNKYLVSQMLTTGPVNTQSTVVIAVVTIGFAGTQVKLTTIQE